MTQSAQATGIGNIIVQVCGDGNQVAISAHDLVLTPVEARVPRAPISTPLHLLETFRTVTPFVGREMEQRILTAWLDAPAPISIRVVTGRGGAGKTRLAIELLRTRTGAGWQAGFAKLDELRRFAANGNLARVRWAQPTLIVIDYAAAAAGELCTLLGQLANHPARQGDAPPFRILLLEREADFDAGWLNTLLRDVSDSHIVTDEFFGRALPIQLHPLPEANTRRAILQGIMETARAHLPRYPVPSAARLARIEEALAAEGARDPLTIMMAATLALLDRTAPLRESPNVSREALALQLADHELRRIRTFAPPHNTNAADLLTHLAGYVALAGGIPVGDAVEVAAEECAALGRTYFDGPGALVERLHTALPAPDGGIATITPDIIAEALALRALQQRPAQQDAAVLRAIHRYQDTALPNLIRLAQDFADSNPAPIRWLEKLIDFGAKKSSELLRAIHNVLPEESLALGEVACRVTGTLLKLYNGQQWHGRSESELDMIATLYNNIAIRLSAIGNQEKALRAGQCAVAIYEELSSVNPDAFWPYLAMSLNTLANRLSDLGQHDKACEVAQRSVVIYQELSSVDICAFWPNLATSLNTLTTQLIALRRYEEGYDVSKRAVEIFEKTATNHPSTFRPAIAMGLNNMAACLHGLEEHDKAYKVALDAVNIYAELVSTRPDAFQPNFAKSLNTLACQSSILGQHQEAYEAALRAVIICEELAATRPEAFRSSLAASLHSLAHCLNSYQRHKEALHAIQRAIEIIEELANVRSDVFHPKVASFRGTQGSILKNLSCYDEAVATFHRGITELFDSFQRLPQAYAGLMTGLVQDYLLTIEEAGLLADDALLERVREIFESLPDEPSYDTADQPPA